MAIPCTIDEPTRPTRRRWLRFSLRALLLLVTAVGVLLAAGVSRYQNVARARAAVDEITERGGQVDYLILEPPAADGSMAMVLDPDPPGPRWLRSLLGDHFFADGVELAFFPRRLTTILCSSIGGCGSIRHETIRFTDDDLQYVLQLPRVDRIDLSETAVTADGQKRLKAAFPRATIERD